MLRVGRSRSESVRVAKPRQARQKRMISISEEKRKKTRTGENTDAADKPNERGAESQGFYVINAAIDMISSIILVCLILRIRVGVRVGVRASACL